MSTPIISFKTVLYNSFGAFSVIVTTPVPVFTSDIYDDSIYSQSTKCLLIVSISLNLSTSTILSLIFSIYIFLSQ